ncbi:MAG: glycosyltransferase [Sulfuricella sp.]|nr:glycosyltransferase [Sulfuricella sp.]
MNPTTEVIVCTYNGQAYIAEQLDSILAQTTGVDQISIYDDRSSDGTVSRIGEFVERLAPEHRRRFAVHVNERNLGYAQNFIAAIARATGDVLFLCDQDDVWERDKVEVFLGLFEAHGPDMVFSDGSLIGPSGQKIGRTSVLGGYGLNRSAISRFRARAFDLLMKRNYINGAAAAVRRTAAQQALPLPCDMPHDYWLALWCSLHGGIVATPRRLYRYRQHHGNAIGIGSGNPLYVWLGIWRQPNAPRERDLRIWKAVTGRIAALPGCRQADAARRKLDWLTRVVAADRKGLPRAFEILKSGLNGSYLSYSGGHAFLRDVVSLLKPENLV